jgi:hypothetical protein
MVAARDEPPLEGRMKGALLAITLLSAPALVASPASAQAEVRWSEEWARVHPAAYAVTGLAVGGALFFDFLVDPGPEALLRGPGFIDAPWRTRLMAQNQEDRERAATLSDVLLGVMLAWPFFDSIVVAGIGHQSTDVLWQMSMINAESYAADLLINTLFKQLVARERPHGARCTLEERLEDPRRCGPGGRLRSFYSGHSSASFNAAGLVCVHHLHLPLYGGGAPDYFACGTALLTAAIVATLRVVADRHYVSDVLTGAVVGFATGFLLPYLLHYQWDPRPHVPAEPPGHTAGPLTFSPSFAWGGPF